MAESYNDADRCIRRFKDLETQKLPWLTHYQALAEIFLTRKSDFTRENMPGEFLQDEIFDNTPQYAAYLMASVFLSMLWPDSARTFNVKPVRRLRGIQGVEDFFRFVNEEMHSAMDRPRAGLSLALMEHFLEDGIFGTSGIGAFEGPVDDMSLPVVYEPWAIKGMCISENAQGFVDTIYYKTQMTVRQVYEQYNKAPDKVSAKVIELYKAGKPEDPVEVLIVIEPKKPEEGKKGVAGMSVRTLHIDKTNKFTMRESGFDEMPVMVGRMFKTMREPYGRSSAMTALPAAQSLNALSEAILVAAEKQLDPPLGVLDDGRLGGGVIDTSAGALNVFNSSGRLATQNPIFPLFTVGEFQSAEKLKEQLIQEIMQAFFLDRLLDLNNQTQMTAFETSVRNRMRGESLGSIFARQEKEVLTPMIERSFNIMWRRGHFGVVKSGLGVKLRMLWNKLLGKDETIVPEIIVQAVEAGLDVYEIEYISPAKRFMQAEKLQGIFTASDAIVALAPFLPGITDNIDSDDLARNIFELSGAPRTSLRTVDAVRKLRAEMQQQQNEVNEIEAGKQVSEIARNVAQARATMGTAGAGGGK